MKLSIFIFKFLLIGALFIVSNEVLYMQDAGDREEFVGMYTAWLGNIFSHVRDITGYVVNNEWLPSEEDEFAVQKVKFSG
jgi:hypothetical protein